MATTTKCSGTRVLDPVQGLVDYVNDIKPYHTKIIEVLVEYVHQDAINVTILDDTHIQVDMAFPGDSAGAATCPGGYATRIFGDPALWPVVSPNPSISFQSYPAINPSSNSFTIIGDRSGDIIPGTQIDLITYIEDYEHLYSITQVNSGPAGSGYFVVQDPLNDFSTYHPALSTGIQTVGTPNDNRSFTITSITPEGPGLTRVTVAQAVLPQSIAGSLGMVRTAGNNTGTFTVAQVAYNAGSIASWPGYPNPATYQLGNDPHTIVTVVEPLVTPVFIPSASQVYVAFMRNTSPAIERVLSYSNFTTSYSPYVQTPDEGLMRESVIVVTPTSFAVSGNFQVSNIFVGDKLRILGSTGNNGTYTIASVSYDIGTDRTTFVVLEPVADTTADGILEIDIPSNVFIVDGDFRSRFVQGKQFVVSGGSFAGKYTTLTSDYSNGKTRIRTTKEIIDPVTGFDIDSVTTGFVLLGDRTSLFTAGTQFNVYGSVANDGSYTVDTVLYASGQTTVVANEPVVSGAGGGKITPVTIGLIKEQYFGYSEDSDFCEFNPEGYVRVKFHEQLTFDGLGLDFHDDIIAYNLENNDTWGYELPVGTRVDSVAPTIATTEPTYPVTNDLWFNTTNGTLNRWVGGLSTGSPAPSVGLWKKITTAWWLDSDTNLLYYRTKNSFVDTGWVLFLAEPPGYSDAQPANADLNTNAYVNTHDIHVHQVYHRDVAVYSGSPQLNAYILFGGNYIHKFITENWFDVWKVSAPSSWLTQQQATSFPIVDVDDVAGTITIEGEWDWLFLPGCVFSVRTSENNINDFSVAIADVVGSPAHTIITVDIPTVVESPSAGVLDPVQHFYNPGVYVVNVDEVTNSIIVRGNVVDAYPAGMKVQLSGSTSGNNGIWEVAGATYFPSVGSPPSQEITVIAVTGNIPDPDSSGNARVHTPIFQNYSRDLGVILGAVYDPIVDSANENDQVKTYVVPTTPVNTNVDSITYRWAGPLRIELAMAFQNAVGVDVADFLNPGQPAIIPDMQNASGDLSSASIVENLSFGWGVVDWFQYLIREAKPLRGSPPLSVNVFEVYGNATADLQVGQQFRVLGTTNDGLYTITSPLIYNAATNTTDIPVALIANNEKGGWVESAEDYGMRLIFEDTIGVGVTENAEGAVLQTGGNIIGAFDYAYWDVGSYDESLGTVIYLYSNTF